MKIEEEKRMNKFKKAAEHFSSYSGNDCYSEKMQNYCELAVEALEKQIPKKPTKTLDVRYGNGYEYNDWICPTCGNFLCFEPSPDVRIHHCKCGQKLDWGFTSGD